MPNKVSSGIRSMYASCTISVMAPCGLEPATYLDLVDVAGNAAHPACPVKHSVPVDYHHAAVLQTPDDDIKSLRDVALDQTRHALPHDSRQLVLAMRLREDLATADKEAVDVLHDDVEQAVLAVGQVGGEALPVSLILKQMAGTHLVPLSDRTSDLVHQRPGLPSHRAIPRCDCRHRRLRFVRVWRWLYGIQ